MKSTGALTRPPRAPVWLVDSFASSGEAEAILGDLHEEFSAIVARNGIAPARHWYWRQCARTLGHLVIAPFRTAPRPTLGVAVAGLALSMMMPRLRAAGVGVVVPPIARDGVDPWRHFRHFLFFVTANVLAQILTGWTIACIAQRRPMACRVVGGVRDGRVDGSHPAHRLTFRIRLVWSGGPIMLGAAMAARRLRKDYEVAAAAFGR